MPYQKLLDTLVRDTHGAVAAILVDYEGEAVVVAGNALPHYDLKVIGAYGGIYFDQLNRVTDELDLGIPEAFGLEVSGKRLLSRLLKDGYYLVVIVRDNAPAGLIWHHVDRCCNALVKEL